MRRTIVVVMGDSHAGSKLALMPPDMILHDESTDGQPVDFTPEQTASQRYLWELYQEVIEWVGRLAGRDEVVLVHNGDVTQGLKYPVELVSTRLADQILIACANLSEWFRLPGLKAVRMMAGTGSHSLGEASADILVAEMLAQAQPGLNVRAMYHGLMEINGVTFDCAHHGPFTGSREWLRGNVARFYLRDIMMREIMGGNKPPRVVARAHYHSYVREELYEGQHHSTLVVTPSWTMLGDYAHQAARSPDRVSNGLVCFELVDGEVLEMYDFIRTIDIRTREVL